MREFALPARGHGAALRPGTTEAVIVARQPGRFALAVPLAGNGPEHRFHAPEDRHFQGHAVFAPDGRTLFATENDFEGEQGMVGVYDATDRYRRIGEFPSQGIGPHEIVAIPGGDVLAVANGGILTHPDSGRVKLNLESMTPSIAYFDRKTGSPIASAVQPPGSMRKLSIRHIVPLAGGAIAITCQDEARPVSGAPLVAVHRPGTAALDYLPAPDGLYLAMEGYCGSVATDISRRIVAVSSPRGNLVAFWNALERRFLGKVSLTDGCGIAGGPSAGSFMLTSGTGVRSLYDLNSPQVLPAPEPGARPWDNHLTRLTSG